MKILSTGFGTLIRTFLLLSLAGSTAAIAQAPEPAAAPAPKYSGWLKDYSGLETYQDAVGSTVMRKVSPKLTPQNYNAVLIEKVELFPKPQPTDAVSASTLEGVAKYADAQIREVLGSQVKIVDKPGPGVARVRVALTGAAAEKEGLKPYQLIPIAFVLTTASRAASGSPHYATISVEAEMTDSVSGEPLLVAVRHGKGETVDGDKVTTDSLKPLLGKWIAGALNEVPKFIATK
jgi:hypothetical protein